MKRLRVTEWPEFKVVIGTGDSRPSHESLLALEKASVGMAERTAALEAARAEAAKGMTAAEKPGFKVLIGLGVPQMTQEEIDKRRAERMARRELEKPQKKSRKRGR